MKRKAVCVKSVLQTKRRHSSIIESSFVQIVMFELGSSKLEDAGGLR